MNTTIKLPAKRRKVSTPAERLQRAEQAVEKAHAYAAKMAERAKKASDRQAKAAEKLATKTRRAEKYVAIGKQRERKLDTRKKIIAGALALQHMKFDSRYKQALWALIDEYVTSDQDRALFDLPPLPEDDQRRINPPKVY